MWERGCISAPTNKDCAIPNDNVYDGDTLKILSACNAQLQNKAFFKKKKGYPVIYVLLVKIIHSIARKRSFSWEDFK